MGRKKNVQVIKSRGEQTRQGLTVKEWQRTPMQLLMEHCQGAKRPRPKYLRAACRNPEEFRTRVILPDPKGKSEKDINVVTTESYSTEEESRHASALLALFQVDGERPFNRKLPEPYASAWVTLMESNGCNNDTSGVASKRKQKESAKNTAEEFTCEYCSKTFKKDHGLQIHLKREHQDEIAAAEAAAAAAENGSQEESQKSADDNSAEAQQASFGESLFDFNAPTPAVAKLIGSAPKAPQKEAFSITAQGRYATKYERRIESENRHQERRKVQQKIEAFKTSNPYATIYLSDENRVFIEGVLKSHGVGSKKGQASAGSSEDVGDWGEMNQLLELGFRKEDVVDAFRSLGNDAEHEEYLDWLCLFAPEDYLPKGYNPKGKQMEVFRGRPKTSLVAGLSLMAESVTAEVADFKGGSDTNDSDLFDTLFDAYSKFMIEHLDTAWPVVRDCSAEDDESWAELRADERMALEAMFEDGEVTSRLDVSVGDHSKVDCHRMRLGSGDDVLLRNSVLEVVLLSHSSVNKVYPSQAPVVLFWNADLNKHMNMHMTLELSRHALQLPETPLLYELWDMAKQLVSDVVQKRPTFPFPAPAHDSGFQRASELVAGSIGQSGKASSGKKKKSKNIRSESSIDNSKELKEEQDRMQQSDPAYQKMQQARSRLPAAKNRLQVVQAVEENQVVLIAGETGCGKTTQVPQFLLDDAISRGVGGKVNILCTQPRRLAAIGVAMRVSQERCEQIGSTVGYQIRLENKTSEQTRLRFVTTGILLRRLQNDVALEGVTHILVDEVHERGVDTDFLLSILKSVLARRPDMKLLLMSATMDSAMFCEYFNTRAVISIPGFVHPVSDFYLEDVVQMLKWPVSAGGNNSNRKPKKGQEPRDGETEQEMGLRLLESDTDYDLVGNLVRHIDQENSQLDGSILVFMSGAAEISKAITAIQRHATSKLLCLPLHGGLSGKDQARVFERAPKGVRKVVVSTNVAETSITIDDVVFVIDSGKLKETQYDASNRMSMLVETWVSQANARQRRGRAGRVRPGQCFKLFTKSRHDGKMMSHQLPEIHRVPLEQLVLQVLCSELGQPQEFMDTLMEPPPTAAVGSAVRLLLDVGAAMNTDAKKQGSEEPVALTALGRHLAQLPMDVRIGKMLIYGSLLQCADQVLTVAAALSVRSPFVSPPDKRDAANQAKKQLLGDDSVELTQSDHICLLYAYERWNASGSFKERKAFEEKYFLHGQALNEIHELRKDLRRTLVEIGFDGSSSAANRSGDQILSRDSIKLVKAAICAGLYPNVINVRKPIEKFAETHSGAVAQAPQANMLRMLVQPQTDDPMMKDEPVQASNYKGSSKLERVFLHPSSVNFHQREYHVPWMVYREKVKTSKVFIRDCTVVPPYSLLLFGGDIKVSHDEGVITVDGWINFKAPARVGVLVRELRKLLDELLEKKILEPTLDISKTDVLACIKKLLVDSGLGAVV